MVTASRAASRTGAASPPDQLVEPGERPGAPSELLEDRLLLAPEQLGQHAVDHHRGELHGRLVADPVGELDRLGDRHLLGGARPRRRPVTDRVREDVEHPVGLGSG